MGFFGGGFYGGPPSGSVSSGGANDGDVLTADGAGGVSWEAPAGGGGGGPLHKFDAAGGPSGTDDAGQGYSPGSLWHQPGTQPVYVCIDATVGTAIWVPMVTINYADQAYAAIDHTHTGVYAAATHYHDADAIQTGTLPPVRGGTGIPIESIYAGMLLIGNSGGSFMTNTITAGTGVTVTNGDGSIEIEISS